MFLSLSLFCLWLSLSLIKELFLLELISITLKRILELIILFYFLGIILFYKNSFLIILPCILLFCFIFFLKKQEQKKLFLQLCSLLIPLESSMKSGMSFLNAWNKSLQEVSSNKKRERLQEFSEVLKFQNKFFYHENKEVERFINELMSIKQSFQPLKRVQHLQRKLRVELKFRLKSQRALLQIRTQSFILTAFYVGLLINTLIVNRQINLFLMLSSLILFLMGLIWILKTGRRMKWSV
ncbi:MAG: hypothetical protein GDA46_01230 [Bdellovibrionales bacterium]|nr:hypothetical protein [Bdellovibrionales bacterium]